MQILMNVIMDVYFIIGRRINNGLIRLNHSVLELSDKI